MFSRWHGTASALTINGKVRNGQRARCQADRDEADVQLPRGKLRLHLHIEGEPAFGNEQEPFTDAAFP